MLLEKEIADKTLDLIGEAVLRTDAQGKIEYLNRMAEDMTGWRRDEACGRPVKDVLRIIGSRPTVVTAMGVVTQGEKTTAEMASGRDGRLIRRDGFEFAVDIKVSSMYDHDGKVAGSVVSFQDVSAVRAKALEMSHSAQHDVLTDLPNRALFNDRLTQAIVLAKRQGNQLAVMFVDIDHFKKINDSLGHDIGDKLLQSVSKRLVANVRKSDTISRMGGDEFVVLLSQVEHAEDAAFSARKILRSLAVPYLVNNKSLDINASIGISTYPADGEDAESLIKTADNAMYEAKRHGRSNFQFFRHEMHAQLAERHSLEADLRCALGRNEFVLHYQPIVSLHTGKITGVEALLRWQHPKRGLVPPVHFIPIAEEYGLIVHIGHWVRIEACKQVRAWEAAGLGIVPLSVNVSASEFGAKDFLSGIQSVLISTGVKPESLVLDLTESVLMLDAEAAVVTLSKLKILGVQLAIDDFGTGYSSFTYLRRFPSDALKLHQSFVQEITVDPGDATIVSAMSDMGKGLQKRVIAEGVETRAQLEFLKRHGCDEAQGYYFSRPVTAEQASKFLEFGLPVQTEAEIRNHNKASFVK